jgi:hypothetical protein
MMEKLIHFLYGLYKFREVQLPTLSTGVTKLVTHFSSCHCHTAVVFMCEKALDHRIYGHFISFFFLFFLFDTNERIHCEEKGKAFHFISQNANFRINNLLLLSLEPFWNPLSQCSLVCEEE